MHYYQHHIGDFIKATARLSDSQTIVYLRLLWMYYDSEKPLKNDLEVLAMQTGGDLHDVDLLLRAYFNLQNGVWHHSRCDIEIGEYQELITKKSNAGKTSAEQRKNKRSTRVKQMLDTSSTDEQLTNNHKPRTINHIDTPDGVDDLVWKDFVEFRKKRKAPITDRVIEGLAAEAKIAKMSLNDVIKECVVRGWQSFKAEWVAGKQNSADIARVTVPGSQERDPALAKLDRDRELTKPPDLATLARIAELKRRQA